MRIADPAGVWYKNNGQYQITDPESKTTFWPNELVKATDTKWLKGQPTMALQPDPLAPAEVVPEASKKASAKA